MEILYSLARITDRNLVTDEQKAIASQNEVLEKVFKGMDKLLNGKNNRNCSSAVNLAISQCKSVNDFRAKPHLSLNHSDLIIIRRQMRSSDQNAIFPQVEYLGYAYSRKKLIPTGMNLLTSWGKDDCTRYMIIFSDKILHYANGINAAVEESGIEMIDGFKYSKASIDGRKFSLADRFHSFSCEFALNHQTQINNRHLYVYVCNWDMNISDEDEDEGGKRESVRGHQSGMIPQSI